jgi:hypothetical protein
MVRIIWPHHPLYLTKIPLVELWDGRGERLVVELPDGSHTRIPASWADDGSGPVPAYCGSSGTLLSVEAVEELVALLRRLSEQDDGA